MPSNRFDTSANQEYVSQYVPMPFEAMYKVGMGIKEEHAKKQAEVDALSDALNKIKVTDQVLVNTPGQGSGVGYASTGYAAKKAAVIAKNAAASKQLTDDYYAGKLDASQFSQRVASMKNELDVDYQQLKIAEANSLNIDAQDKLYRAHAKAGQQTHLANQLASHGDDFIKDPYKIEYKGASIADAIDEIGTMNKFASDFKDKIMKNTTSYTDAAGKIHYKSITGVGEKDIRTAVNAGFDNDAIGHDYKERVNRQLVNHGKKWDDEIDVPTYDDKGKKNGTKKAKIGDVIYGDMREQFTQGVVAKARHENPDEKILDDKRFEWAHDKKLKEEEFAGPMPTYQNPLTTTGTTLTPKSGLGWLGINVDVINDNGSLNSKAYESRGTNLIKDVKENNDGSVIVTDIYGNKSTHKTLIDAYSEFKKKPAPNLLTEHYTNLINTARGLGLEIPKKSNDKSKTDFDELQKQLSKYGQNMQQQGNTSAGLQSRFGNNLSNELLGTVTAKDDGTTVFKKSPLLGGAKIVDQSTGEVISENKEEVAKDGAIRGINYFAPEAGTYRMDSKNKAYNYNPGDNTLNKMTQNTHGLTQDIIKARQGKQNSKTIIDSDNNTVGDYANNIVNSLKENFKTIPANNPQGMMLANHLNENLTKLNGYEPVSVKTSDILIQEGPRKGSPKYNYVAYEHKGFGTTNEADDKILRVDAESGQTEIMTLGDIHASERDYLQQNYTGAFEPTK